MKKKNIGFILFGAAGGELLSILATLFIFPRMYERMGVPQTPVMDRILMTISLVTFFILIIVGVILLIKFRNEEAIDSKKGIKRVTNICQNCGNKISPGFLSCSKCGWTIPIEGQ